VQDKTIIRTLDAQLLADMANLLRETGSSYRSKRIRDAIQDAVAFACYRDGNGWWHAHPNPDVVQLDDPEADAIDDARLEDEQLAAEGDAMRMGDES